LKTLVLGIGNPILGDDGIGSYVAQELASKVKGEDVDVKDANTHGLNLLELLAGYDRVIIVDAIKTENGEVGRIYKLRPEDFTNIVHFATSLHDTNLATTIEIGKKLLAEQMPNEIIIFAVEVEEVIKFTEEMTEKVKETIPKVVNLVLGEIGST